jgi:hypothetical protein
MFVGCPDRVVEWSSSGLLLEVALTYPWFCTVPEVIYIITSNLIIT